MTAVPEKVKKFIESNIQYIRVKDWMSLFKNWYILNDDYYWEEFIEVLNKIGIDVLEESKTIRETIIVEITRSLLANFAATTSRISHSRLRTELRSYLGFTDEELVELWDKAAKAEKLQIAKSGYYRV